MIQKSITLFVIMIAIVFCANAFAGGPTPGPPLSVHITGCFSSGAGDFHCLASASGGMGSYNYWWMHSGNGQPYQTNSPSIDITGCVDGRFNLTVQILDRATGQIARSATISCPCGDGGFGDGEGGFGD